MPRVIKAVRVHRTKYYGGDSCTERNLKSGTSTRKNWPEYDPAALVKDTVEIAVQTNGKVRGRIDIPAALTREDAEAYFLGRDDIKEMIGDKPVVKLVFVPGRLVNIVVKG